MLDPGGITMGNGIERERERTDKAASAAAAIEQPFSYESNLYRALYCWLYTYSECHKTLHSWRGSLNPSPKFPLTREHVQKYFLFLFF